MRVEETVACIAVAHNLMLGAGVSTIRERKSKCAMRNAHVTAA